MKMGFFLFRMNQSKLICQNILNGQLVEPKNNEILTLVQDFGFGMYAKCT
jgi:hypothetical protein